MIDPPPRYPEHLIHRIRLRDGTAVTLRPIRPDDAERENAFASALSAESRYFRFLDTLHHLTPQMLARFVNIDYHDHLALVAVVDEARADPRAVANERPTMLRQVADDKPTMLRQVGVARYVVEAGGESCEFAIVIADDWQGRGLATALMQQLMEAARARGVRRMYGDVLAANHKMLALTHRLGFRTRRHPDDLRMVIVEREL